MSTNHGMRAAMTREPDEFGMEQLIRLNIPEGAEKAAFYAKLADLAKNGSAEDLKNFVRTMQDFEELG